MLGCRRASGPQTLSSMVLKYTKDRHGNKPSGSGDRIKTFKVMCVYKDIEMRSVYIFLCLILR